MYMNTTRETGKEKKGERERETHPKINEHIIIFSREKYAHTLCFRSLLCLLFSPDPERECLEPATRTFPEQH